MTRPDVDWRYLCRGLPLPLAVAAMALVAFLVSLGHGNALVAELDSRARQLAELDQQRSQLAARLQARANFAARYAELEEAGIAGPEQRLAWAQALRDGGAALRLPYLRYTAGPQQAFEAPWLEAGVAAPVNSAPVELQVGLVHELDLMRLLARLEEAPGLLEVTGCSLERSARDVAPAADRANLTGVCQLRWLSIPSQGGLLAAAEVGP